MLPFEQERETMTTKDHPPPKSSKIIVKNPRYKGATAGMVARALLRQRKSATSRRAITNRARKVNPGI